MVTIQAASYEYGNSKQYIAHILGRDSKFQFRREFVGRKRGKRNDVTEYSTDEIGIYEDCDIDRKGKKDIGYWLVLPTPGTEELIKTRANLEDVLALAKRMDAGEELQDMVVITPSVSDPGKWHYEIRTKAEVKAATVGQTISTATEGCWQILQSLPPTEAKKVLAALKLRVSPPKEQATVEGAITTSEATATETE